MSDTDESKEYEVVVIGGGPAGLQTALYTTRLGHDTALIDRGGGRAAMMVDTHNVIGITEDVSGNEFLGTARQQLEEYGTDLYRDLVTEAEQLDDGRFKLTTNDDTFVAERVVLGVGFNDKRPKPPLPRTGKGLHYCLHCDAYMFVDESVYVMGHSDSAAYVAMIMLNFTDEVDILLRGDDPSWSDETDELVRAHPIDIVEEEIDSMTKGEDGWLESFTFEDGTTREYKGGFAMYGSDYNTTLFEQLDVELNDDGTVPVGDHGETSVDGVYAVGDITPGHNQIPVAMGKGAKAGIAIHMELREFPKSLDEIRANGEVSVEDAPGISPGLLQKAKQFNESHADD
ncbi:NAD(P)/FAD-dependent oxidoreductase [Haloferax sp. DFSO60]|uniref:NAD(P)/FAD-dependent oxidoreductase n=1 Tax=Haloferax sp. DFSO60 TaxID=3388652 RepID=UPI00397BEA5A